jgi:hypothetical protein
LRFGGFLSGPAIPGLSGVNIRDDSKGALEVGGVSLEGASILPKGKLGVLRFEVLTGFTGVADVTLKGASIIRATGRKDSDAAFKVSITKSGSGPAAPPPSGGLTPKAGNGTGMLDLNTAAGDQKSQTKYSVKAGDKIDVQVLYGKESANAGGFQVVLGFDPAKIKVAAYKKDGTAFADAMALPAQTKGDSVTYGASILGGTTTAKGALAILTFETLPGFSGDTEITLKSIMIRISGVGNTVVPGASVVISSGTGGAPGKPTPDFSGDGEVGFDDFFEFAAAFGQPATGANAKFDLDGDGEIGFGDFFEFAAAFGTKVGAGKTVSALPGVNALANVSLATAPSAEGFTVRLAASDVAQMRGYTAVLSFDPSALAFVKAERAEDALLTRAGSTPLFLAQETSPGRVVLADAAIGGTASGEGALANLVFRRIGADGASSVRVDLARIFDGAGGANTLAATDRDLPPAYLLAQNYPNPFNPETRIAFGLPEDGQVRLTVYNMMGQMVRTLVNGPQPAGNHAVRWDGRDDAGRRVASGIYLYRLQANGFESVRRMMLVK